MGFGINYDRKIAVQTMVYTKMTVQSFGHTVILLIIFGFRFFR